MQVKTLGSKMLDFFIYFIFFHRQRSQWRELAWHRTHVIAAVMPNRHGILTDSPPSGPPLPEDPPRRWNKLVSHLWGHKQIRTHTDCKARPKSPSSTLHYCNNCRYYSCTSIRRVQNWRGLSPQSGQLFSLQCSPPPHYQPRGAPCVGTGPKTIWLSCCCCFKIIIGLELIFGERLSQRVKTVWKFTWSHWNSVLDFRGPILRGMICESPVSWPSDTIAVCWDRKHEISHTFIPGH